MYNFKTNDLIEAVLYNKNRIKSFINYLKLLYKIRRISPDYATLEIIYEFIDQLNFAYFYCLDDSNKLFIKDSRKDSKNKKDNDDKFKRSLIYKDRSTTITLTLIPNNIISLEIERLMGYKKTSITFEDEQAVLNNKLEEQLFINCTNVIMDELYNTVKKYRHFRRLR